MITWSRQQLFKTVHSNNLVYNQCWEDPRLDQVALGINSSDHVAVITSAGCNALDYLLSDPARIDAIDINPRQNALLQLKIAGIKYLEYDDFFSFFGLGHHPQARQLYYKNMRHSLPYYAKDYWDKHIDFFTGSGWRPSFYFRGASGFLARLMTHYISIRGIEDVIAQAFQAETIEEQQKIYFEHLKPQFWNGLLRWVSRRAATMSCLGVPRSQFEQIEFNYQGGMARFIEDCLEAVFAQMPLKDNYFWHLYLFGSYKKNCSPNYLKEENFEVLKSRVDNIHTHTSTLLRFLKNSRYPITKISLLDHMDWLYRNHKDVLHLQWQSLIERSTPQTKIIWRSASLNVDFIDSIPIKLDKSWHSLGHLLQYDREKASELHKSDRVHTYGSFYIAQVLLPGAQHSLL